MSRYRRNHPAEDEKIRQVIRIYRNAELFKTYCIELVNCDEALIEADYSLRTESAYFSRKVTEIYYLCPTIMDADKLYVNLSEALFDYRIRKHNHYEFKNFNRQFYEIIHNNQWIAMAECKLLNHIFDEKDTLRKRFIRRMRRNNIYSDHDYKPAINTLKYPADPDSLFVNFEWEQLAVNAKDAYDLETAIVVAKQMLKNKKLFKTISKIYSEYNRFIHLWKLDRKLPIDKYEKIHYLFNSEHSKRKYLELHKK